jgi:hypothetical protein
MSALGQKRTCAVQQLMSALLPIATAKADIRWWIGEGASKALRGACDARQASSRPTNRRSVSRKCHRLLLIFQGKLLRATPVLLWYLICKVRRRSTLERPRTFSGPARLTSLSRNNKVEHRSRRATIDTRRDAITTICSVGE